MALSVLTIPESGGKCGLWDGFDYITFGTQDQCYSVKHAMEEAEQQKDNEEWRKKYIEENLDRLQKAGYSRAKAETIINSCLDKFKNEFRYPNGTTLP